MTLSSNLNAIKILFAILCLCGPPFSFTAYAEINKCIVNGKTVFTDEACPTEASETESLELNHINGTASTPNEETPSEDGSYYQSQRWYSGYYGYQQARRISKAWQAPMYIYSYTDWCGYCKKFNKKLLPSPLVKAALAHFVKVKINPDKGAKETALFKLWGGSGYPTIFFQKDDTDKPAKQKGPFRVRDKKTVLVSPQKYAKTLETIYTNHYKHLKELEKQSKQ